MRRRWLYATIPSNTDIPRHLGIAIRRVDIDANLCVVLPLNWAVRVAMWLYWQVRFPTVSVDDAYRYGHAKGYAEGRGDGRLMSHHGMSWSWDYPDPRHIGERPE